MVFNKLYILSKSVCSTILMVVMLVLWANCVFSQGALPGKNYVKLSLQDAIQKAQKENLDMQQAQISFKNSELNLKQSINNKLPNLSGYSGLSTNFGRGIDFITNTYSSVTNTNNNLGANASLVLYQGGFLQNSIKKNEYELKASEQDMLALKNNVSLNIALAYLNALNFEDQVKVAVAQTLATKLQIERTEKLVRAGTLPNANVLDLKAQLANEETNKINVEGLLANAKLSLAQLMNLENISDFELVPLPIELTQDLDYGQSINTVIEQAIVDQPSIKASDLRVQSESMSIKLAEAGFKPSVNLSGGIGSGYGSAGKDFKTGERLGYFTQIDQNFAQNIGVNINIPIFSQFQNKTRLQQANLQKINAEINGKKAKQSLRQDIETAFVNRNNSVRTYLSLQEQIKALEEAYRMAEVRFNAGAIDYVNYSLQKVNLDKAKSNAVQAKYDLIFRTKILDFYQNKPL